MAKGKKVQTEAQAALAAFDKRYDGKELDDAGLKKWERDRAPLKLAVDTEKFKTLANARIDRALRAIDALAKLSRLPTTGEQIDAMKKAFQVSLSNCFEKFESKKENGKAKVVKQIV